MTYKCDSCGDIYKELPTVSYPDGTGKIMSAPGGCRSCGAGRDAIRPI